MFGGPLGGFFTGSLDSIAITFSYCEIVVPSASPYPVWALGCVIGTPKIWDLENWSKQYLKRAQALNSGVRTIKIQHKKNAKY